MKKLAIIVSAMLIANASFSQVRPKIDAQSKKPSTTKNAAKADVLIINKKNIKDSSMVKKVPSSTSTQVYKPATTPKRKLIKKG